VRNSPTTERILVGLAPAALCAAALVVAPAGGAGLALPDLDQEVPWELHVTRSHGEYRLGFGSAVRNVGDGPLIISGRRERTAVPTMTADQLVEGADGSARVAKHVGRLRYVKSADHAHWHLLGFERYELRPAAGGAGVRDRKTGFCLGDRYHTGGQRLPGQPRRPRYTGRCGLGDTARLHLEQGISVGYGDDYAANLEGQSLPLTGLHAGRYVLVHTVNAQRRLHETDYANNAASLLLRLRWRAGAPSVRLLRRCPDTARCHET
jgi:Lysyl oxidase